MDNQVSNITLGKSFTFTFNANNIYCSCYTKYNTRCMNKHNILYKLSNDITYTTCSIPAHKKHIMNTFLVNGVTANVFRLIKNNQINNDEYICTYTVCGISVDNKCNYDYPVIQQFDKITELKDSIQNNINQHESDLSNCRYEIDTLRKYIKQLMNEMKELQTGRFELSKALTYIRMNTQYNHSILPPTEENTLCCICYEPMTNNTSGKLYECNHVFHYECIQKWFGKKDSITCPCCRTECDPNNYFTFNH